MEKTPSAFSKTMNVFNLGLIRLYNLLIIYTQKKRNEKKLKEIQKKYQNIVIILYIFFGRNEQTKNLFMIFLK